MDLTIALAGSIGISLVMLLLIGLLQRKFEIFRKLAIPLFVGAVVTGVNFYITFAAEVPAWLQDHGVTLVLFWAAIFVLRVIGLYLFDVYLYAQKGYRFPPVLPHFAIVAAYLIAGLITLKSIDPELELGALLGAGAVTSLVLGLALQPILTNFFAGVVISLEKPFRINDWIKVGDTDGQVVQMTWRTTHLRTRDNDNVVIPNSEIASRELLNYYYPHPLHLQRVHVGAHYKSPPYRVRHALLNAASRVKGVLEKPTSEVYLISFDESSISYELRLWVEDIARIPRIASQARMEIWEEFKRHDITIPFPIRTLEIEPAARTMEIVRPLPQAVETSHRARLFVIQGKDRGKTIEMNGDSVKVGRSAGCELMVGEIRASKEHLQINWNGQGYVLSDLNSQYGTKLNGNEVRREQALVHLDHILIGDTEIVFESHVQ